MTVCIVNVENDTMNVFDKSVNKLKFHRIICLYGKKWKKIDVNSINEEKSISSSLCQ